MSAPAEHGVHEVAALLAANGHNLSADQILAIANFIQLVGSVEQAQETMEALLQLKSAA